MLFYSEGSTLGICHSIGIGFICFDIGMQVFACEKACYVEIVRLRDEANA